MALFTNLKPLTPDQLYQAHEATLKVLENTGLEFHHPEALEIFKKHGAKVDGTRVFIPRSLVYQALKTAPATYRQRAMDDKKSLVVGDPDVIIYEPHYGAAFIREYDGTKRSSKLEDSIRALKLVQSSDILNFKCAEYYKEKEIVQMALTTKLDTLTPDQLYQVHEATLKVLENTGLEFHHPEALEIFKKHGAKVDGTRVFIPRSLVYQALKTAPATYRQRAMNDKKSLVVGDPDVIIYGPHYGAAFIREYDGTKRSSKLEDSIRALKLVQSSDILNFTGMHWCEALDVDMSIRPLVLAKETLKHSDMPALCYNVLVTTERARNILDILELAFGKFDETNCGIGLSICAASPLRYEASGIEPMIEFAKRSQALYTTPAPLMGISSPITMLGTAIIQNAECLAMIVFTQLINPGTPVVYGVNGMAASLRSGKSAWGSPESVLMCLVNMQLALDMYKLPTRLNAGTTTAELVDYQSAVETTQSVMASVFSGAHMCYEATGVLEDVVTLSFEKLVLDEEILSRAHCMRMGVPFSEEEMAVDWIDEVGPGGLYLSHESTLLNFKKRWTPALSDWDGLQDTNRDIMVRAHEMVEKRIADQPESLIDSALEKELDEFIQLKSAL